MNDETSNKTMVFLIAIAIIVSLGGTFLTLTRLSDDGMTGLAGTNISRGNITLTISDITWINFSVKACSFGSGMAVLTCKMNTTGYVNLTGCSAGWSGCTTPLEIKNIGNNNVSLNITFKNNSAFMGTSAATTLFFKMMNGTSAGANPGCRKQGNWTKWLNWNRVWQPGQHNTTCDRMYYGVGQNTVSLHVQLTFDQSALIGTRRNQIVAYGRTRIG